MNTKHRQPNRNYIMKLTPKMTLNRKAGMTLIELTVVILVLLALIAVLFVGARAYKKGSDKAACLMNQRNVQQAVRSYANLNPTDAAITVDDLVGPDKFLGSLPLCPGGGTYEANYGAAAGELAYACSLAAADGHAPSAEDLKNW
jgi:type II secretory pathway pseudopilin PulG